MIDAYLGTHNGVYRLHGNEVTPVGLAAERVSAVYALRPEASPALILAGTYGNGLFRSTDDGETWQQIEAGLSAPAFRTIGPDPTQPGAILCGTEPGRIFRSADGGHTWQELDGIRDLDGYQEWFLPYSPRAGAVRNVYSPPGEPHRLLASVEVGGLIQSRDGGATWEYVDVGVDHDIHHIGGHPTDGSVLYASLGYAALKSQPRHEGPRPYGGITRSRDGGATWEKVETDYTRATIVPPTRPDLLLAGPSPDVGRNGRIVVSADGGDTWQPAHDGLEVPMPDMVENFVAAPDDSIWAISSAGRLLRAEPGAWHWQPALPGDPDLKVETVSFV